MTTTTTTFSIAKLNKNGSIDIDNVVYPKPISIEQAKKILIDISEKNPADKFAIIIRQGSYRRMILNCEV